MEFLHCNEPGGPNSVTITAGLAGSNCQRALPAGQCKKRGMVGRAFCNKKRGEEKMKKGKKSDLYKRPFPNRAAVCLVLDLYGFIIAVNC